MQQFCTLTPLQKVYHIPIELKKQVQFNNNYTINEILKRIKYSQQVNYSNKVLIIYSLLEWTIDRSIFVCALSYHNYNLVHQLQSEVKLFEKIEFEHSEDEFAMSYYNKWKGEHNFI